MRRATVEHDDGAPDIGISIHALREESDQVPFLLIPAQRGISIHALREESDTLKAGYYASIRISIHALREESDRGLDLRCHCDWISIHALREESDTPAR